jgi:glycerol-3-phosphate O-acyltransferase
MRARMRQEDQEKILTELRSRVLHAISNNATAGKIRLDEVLADSIYHEQRRLREEKDSRTRNDDTAFWRKARTEMQRANDRTLLNLLGQAVDRYGSEIAGYFDMRVYEMVTRVGEPALGLLLNAMSPKRLVKDLGHLPGLSDALVVQGETEHLRRLHELGTVICVPTHVSNMDSIIVGYALYKLGLPPFIYGAGLNLFSNPLIGYFMRNLGAYTVDRKKQDPLYKEALKEYATLTLEYGYDNIFFPGGTRCRSGAVEKRLKLGLLGTGISAYVNNLKRKKNNPKVFIVPATISYELVLEAETLIDDFLKDVGKSRYIITDDEFSKPQRVVDFTRQLFSLDSKIFFTVSRGMDPFGNPVDDNGESLDPCGRRVDTSRYVMRNGEPTIVEQRDAEYTKEVGGHITEAYFRDNVVQSTHITARAIMTLLRRQNPGTDPIRLIRAGGERDDVELLAVYQEVERLLTELRGLASRGGIRLGAVATSRAAEEVVTDGLRHFEIYHKTPAAQRRGDRVFPTDRSLLLYYQNRLEGYRLERDEGIRPILTADHRAINKGAA